MPSAGAEKTKKNRKDQGDLNDGTLEFTLPCGIKVKKRAARLLDVRESARILAGVQDASTAAVAATWIPIGLTIVEWNGKPGPLGYADLFELSEKDAQTLLYVHNKQNAPDAAYLLTLTRMICDDATTRQGVIEAMRLTSVLKVPFKEALEMPEADRREMAAMVEAALGITDLDEHGRTRTDTDRK